jgi:hypothetical protein
MGRRGKHITMPIQVFQGVTVHHNISEGHRIIYKGVKLWRGERLVHTYTPFPHFHPSFIYFSHFNWLAKKLSLATENIERACAPCCLPPPPPTKVCLCLGSPSWGSRILFFDSLTLKMKALWSFRTLRTPHSVTWHLILEDFNNSTVRPSRLPTSKGKAVPLQAWSGSEGSRKLRFPDFITTAQEGGKVVSLTHRPHLPPGNSPGTHFC